MQPTFVAALAAFAGAILALALYHAVVVAPAMRRIRAPLNAHDELLGSGSIPGTGRLSSLEDASRELTARVERFEPRASELEALSRTDLSRIGFVRYDAYDDTSSELSYALALLNREGDGVVLSSLYSRSDTRTYGKPVEKFTPLAHASDEELSAIAQARGAAGKQ